MKMKLEQRLDAMSPERASVIEDMSALGWEVRRLRGKRPSWEFIGKTDDGEGVRIVATQAALSREWLASLLWKNEPSFRSEVVELMEDWLARALEDAE